MPALSAAPRSQGKRRGMALGVSLVRSFTGNEVRFKGGIPICNGFWQRRRKKTPGAVVSGSGDGNGIICFNVTSINLPTLPNRPATTIAPASSLAKIICAALAALLDHFSWGQAAKKPKRFSGFFS